MDPPQDYVFDWTVVKLADERAASENAAAKEAAAQPMQGVEQAADAEEAAG